MASLDALLGFSVKSGKLALGSEACRKAISSGKACLAMLSPAASQNTRKEFEALCARFGIRLLVEHDFSLAIGRPACKAAAVVEAGFANTIQTAYDSVYPRNI